MGGQLDGWTRRAAMAGIVMAPALARAGTPDPDPNLLYRKLRYRTDDGPVFWWLNGPKFGVVETELTRLWTMEVGTISRVMQRDDGGFDTLSLEISFLTDPVTGVRLESFQNPYTGETLPVRLTPVGPTLTRYDANGERAFPTMIGGAPVTTTARRTAPMMVGDDVYVRDEVTARVMSPGRSRPFVVNDISIYQGSLRDLADPATSFGAARVVFAEVTGWQQWLRMGERAGSMTSRTVGAKVARYEDLPERWRTMVADALPEIARDPLGALEKPAYRFER
jgi:hypothetical protein